MFLFFLRQAAAAVFVPRTIIKCDNAFSAGSTNKNTMSFAGKRPRKSTTKCRIFYKARIVIVELPHHGQLRRQNKCFYNIITNFYGFFNGQWIKRGRESYCVCW